LKTKKIMLIALGLMILIAISGCQPNDTGYNTRLGTQTRNGNGGLFNNTGTNTPSGNGAWPDGTNQDRNLTGQDKVLYRNNTNLGLNNGFNDGFNNGVNDGLYGNRLNAGLNDGYNTGLDNNGVNNNLSTNSGNMNINANELARKITTLPEVSSCSVATHNNNAVVGLKLSNNQSLGASLRQRIETMIRDTNSNINNVSITTDPNLFTRIQNMSNGMTNGNVTNTIKNDFEDLMRSITPNTNNITR